MRPGFLNDLAIRAALWQAWQDSNSGENGGHEEGGFIVREESGILSIVRWGQGAQDKIILPPHQDCKIKGREIVGSFHTHPNTGSDYLQEPSETDIRAVRDDPALDGNSYEGELVISHEILYWIEPNGNVNRVGSTVEILEQV